MHYFKTLQGLLRLSSPGFHASSCFHLRFASNVSRWTISSYLFQLTPAPELSPRMGDYRPSSIALIKLLGRMSVQFLSTHSRHVFRVSLVCAILHPSGILINTGHSEYCPSSFTNT